MFLPLCTASALPPGLVHYIFAVLFGSDEGRVIDCGLSCCVGTAFGRRFTRSSVACALVCIRRPVQKAQMVWSITKSRIAVPLSRQRVDPLESEDWRQSLLRCMRRRAYTFLCKEIGQFHGYFCCSHDCPLGLRDRLDSGTWWTANPREKQCLGKKPAPEIEHWRHVR